MVIIVAFLTFRYFYIFSAVLIRFSVFVYFQCFYVCHIKTVSPSFLALFEILSLLHGDTWQDIYNKRINTDKCHDNHTLTVLLYC